MCETWQTLNHDQAALGHLRVGLSNNLFGTEDNWICREAKIFWEENGMKDWRNAEVQRIKDMVEKGEAQWTKDFIYKQLIQPFGEPGIGVMDRLGDTDDKAVPRDGHGVVGGESLVAVGMTHTHTVPTSHQ